MTAKDVMEIITKAKELIPPPPKDERSAEEIRELRDETKRLREALHKKEVEELRVTVSFLHEEIRRLKESPPGSKSAMDVIHEGVKGTKKEIAGHRTDIKTVAREVIGRPEFRLEVKYTEEEKLEKAKAIEGRLKVVEELTEAKRPNLGGIEMEDQLNALKRMSEGISDLAKALAEAT